MSAENGHTDDVSPASGSTEDPSQSRSIQPLVAFVALIFTASALLIFVSIQRSQNSELSTIIGVAGVALALIGALIPTMSYLQVGRFSIGPFEVSAQRLEPPTIRDAGSHDGTVDVNGHLSIDEKLQDVLAEIRRIKFDADAVRTHVTVVDSVEQIQSRGNRGEILERAESASTTEVTSLNDSERALALIRDRVDRVRKRLAAEVAVLGRRINLNLLLGIATTVGSLIVLATLVFGRSTRSGGAIDWSYLVPRLSLAVFTEAFAFFFLRLYRSGLEDVKYYQNEISNVEVWALGAEVALVTGREPSIETVVGQLVRVERNFRLGKGESTASLERERMQSQSGSESLEALLRALQK